MQQLLQASDSSTVVLQTMCLAGTVLFEKLNDLDAVQQAQEQKMQQIKEICK